MAAGGQGGVYAILGHGCDRADNDVEIPPGSSYVTLEMCGNVSYELPKIIYSFNDPIVNNDIRNPTPIAMDRLNRYFSIGEFGYSNMLNRHYPHSLVPSPQNSLLAQLDFNELGLGGVIFKSGMYEINVPPPFINNEWGRTYMHFPQGTPITQENLMEIYRGSIYQPDYARIFQNGPIENVRILADIHGGLFNIYDFILNHPGTYYNFACRVECAGNVVAARRARNRSLRRLDINPNNVIEKPIPNGVSLFQYLDYWVNRKVAALQGQPEPPVPDWHAVLVAAGQMRMAQRVIGPTPMIEDGGRRKLKNKSRRKKKTRSKR